MNNKHTKHKLLVEVKILLKGNFLVKITHGNFLWWTVKELKEKRENKTEIIINKNDEYTTSFFIMFMSISRHKMKRNIFI